MLTTQIECEESLFSQKLWMALDRTRYMQSSKTFVMVDRLQWEHIQRVLGEHEGNISATARALGMHRRTLQRKLQKRPVRR